MLDTMDTVCDTSIAGLAQITPFSQSEQNLLRVIGQPSAQEPALLDESVPAGARRRVVLSPDWSAVRTRGK